MTTTRFSMLALALLMVFAMGLPAAAQERGGDEARPTERERDRGQNWRERWENMSEEEREQMRKRMEERRAEYEKRRNEQLRERLDISEEDFELVQPLMQRVQTLLREREMTTRSGRSSQRGGGFGSGGELTDEGKAVAEAMGELRQAVADDNKGDIKDALGKLRKARAAHDKKVSEAREELRSVCTAKWEGEFVVMGLLD